MNNHLSGNQPTTGAIGLVLSGTYNYAEGNTLLGNGIGVGQATNMLAHNVILGNYYSGYSTLTNVYPITRP